MQVILFHLMSYADLDFEATKGHETVGSTCPTNTSIPSKATSFTTATLTNSNMAKCWALTAWL